MARERDIERVDEEELDPEELAELVDAEGSSGTVWFVAGLMLGAVIGAGIALLVAPERGDVTRRHIRTRIEDLREGARDQLENLREEAGEQFRRRRRQLRRRLKART
jgi:gas vesicle protein